MRILLVTTFILVAAHGALAGITAELEPGARPGEFKVMLMNDRSETCAPLVIDPHFTREPEGGVGVTFTVVDERGTTFKPADSEPSYMPLTPGRSLLLSCGAMYGVTIDILHDRPWRLALPAGTYKVSADVTVNVPNLLRRQPHFAERVAQLNGYSMSVFQRKRIMREEELKTNELVFVIHGQARRP